MRINDSRDATDLLALVDALSDQPPKGISPKRLVRETGLDLCRVGELLAKHTDYFVSVGGGPLFALNRFGPCKGAVLCIQEDIAAKLASAEKHERALLAGAPFFPRGF